MKKQIYCFLYMALALCFIPALQAQIVNDGFALQEVIRRKAEEAALTNCFIGGSKICARQEVLAFYEKRLFLPAWQDKEKRMQLLKAIEEAPRHGLVPRDYYYGTLINLHQQDTQTASLEVLGNREILFTDALLLYASHLLNGKVDPVEVNPNWNISRESVSLADTLMSSVDGKSLDEALERMAPQEPSYKALQKELQRYKTLERQGGWQSIQVEEKLEIGAEGKAVGLLRKRLFATGDLPRKYVRGDQYDSTLMQAVVRFQQRHGLDEDGTVGESTLEALNTLVENRIAQIKANLERYRWLPSKFEDFLIRVNIPGFSLEVVRNGEVIQTHKVIVGKKYRQTPVFTSTMKYLVFNPTWTVPPGILANDVIPGVRRSTSYLKKKGLNVYDTDGRVINPDTVNWNSKRIYRYTYQQGPGDDNALGRVKFIFPNPYLVYIHDTPSKYLFARAERAFSSGCMRVENPMELAKYLLTGDPLGTDKGIADILKTTHPKSVLLKETPQVLVLYLTAWSEGQDGMQFRHDIYDRDAKVLESLNATRPLE